jgi:hypothetical protein
VCRPRTAMTWSSSTVSSTRRLSGRARPRVRPPRRPRVRRGRSMRSSRPTAGGRTRPADRTADMRVPSRGRKLTALTRLAALLVMPLPFGSFPTRGHGGIRHADNVASIGCTHVTRSVTGDWCRIATTAGLDRGGDGAGGDAVAGSAAAGVAGAASAVLGRDRSWADQRGRWCRGRRVAGGREPVVP